MGKEGVTSSLVKFVSFKDDRLHKIKKDTPDARFQFATAYAKTRANSEGRPTENQLDFVKENSKKYAMNSGIHRIKAELMPPDLNLHS